MVRAAVVVAVACAVCACGSEGSPAAPSFTGGAVNDAAAPPTDAGADVSYAVCPPALDASFTDLLTRVMSTQASCGTATPSNCHSPSGATAIGSGLNLALLDSGVEGGLDAATIYAELVNHPAANLGCIPSPTQQCPANLERVVPGDAGASLLYIKLMLKTTSDPNYGAGMPLNAPGSVCPATLDAFKTWIDQGAKLN